MEHIKADKRLDREFGVSNKYDRLSAADGDKSRIHRHPE
jgi:hypothetical protein